MTEIVSPLLQSWLADLAASQPQNGEETFWKRVAEAGTPLVEECPGDPNQVTVTFLYKGSSDTRTCAVIGGLLDWDIHSGILSRHPLSSIWHLTILRPRDAFGSYRLSPNDSLADLLAEPDWDKRERNLIADAFNRYHTAFCEPLKDTLIKPHEILSVARFPGAPLEPYLQQVPEPLRGSLTHYRLSSSLLNNERDIWLYRPAAEPAEDLACAVFFDGSCYLSVVPTRLFLDQLIAKRAIPPLAAVFVNPPEPDARNTELTCNPLFTRFLAEELLPFVGGIVPITADPARTLAAGSSFGGLAALHCGTTRPDRFGLVASQAASAAWSPDPQPARGLILRLVEQYKALPGRFHLDIGARETYLCQNCDRPAVIAHRELVEMLKERSTNVKSLEYQGSHDYISWRYSLPLALEWLLRG